MATWPWQPVLLSPASPCLKGCCWCFVGSHIPPVAVRSSVQREVLLGCVLPAVLPVHHLKGTNQTQLILWQSCAWVSPSGYLQTRVKIRGLGTKPALQLPQLLKTKEPFQTLMQPGSASRNLFSESCRGGFLMSSDTHTPQLSGVPLCWLWLSTGCVCQEPVPWTFINWGIPPSGAAGLQLRDCSAWCPSLLGGCCKGLPAMPFLPSATSSSLHWRQAGSEAGSSIPSPGAACGELGSSTSSGELEFASESCKCLVCPRALGSLCVQRGVCVCVCCYDIPAVDTKG